MNDNEKFLELVRRYVKEHPEVATRIAENVQAGIKAALDESNERAVMMESLVVMLAAKRFKGTDTILKEKLRSMKGKTCFAWDWLTEAKP